MVRVLSGTLPKNICKLVIKNSPKLDDGYPTLLSLTLFRQLYQFTNLVEFRFELDSCPSMDDVTIEELSHAFPCLEHLSLGRSSLPNTPPRATLSTLAVLAMNCSRLRSVGMIVDCTVAANATLDSSPPIISENCIETMSLGDSPIDDARFTAHHLSRMFPRLCSLVQARFDPSTANSWDWLLADSWIGRTSTL